MVSFIGTVYSGINSIYSGVKSIPSRVDLLAEEFDKGEVEGRTRNYLPIGTATLYKFNVLAMSALFMLVVIRGVSGCGDGNQNTLICRPIISDSIPYLIDVVVAGSSILFYRMFSKALGF